MMVGIGSVPVPNVDNFRPLEYYDFQQNYSNFQLTVELNDPKLSADNSDAVRLLFTDDLLDQSAFVKAASVTQEGVYSTGRNKIPARYMIVATMEKIPNSELDVWLPAGDTVCMRVYDNTGGTYDQILGEPTDYPPDGTPPDGTPPDGTPPGPDNTGEGNIAGNTPGPEVPIQCSEGFVGTRIYSGDRNVNGIFLPDFSNYRNIIGTVLVKGAKYSITNPEDNQLSIRLMFTDDRIINNRTTWIDTSIVVPRAGSIEQEALGDFCYLVQDTEFSLRKQYWEPDGGAVCMQFLQLNGPSTPGGPPLGEPGDVICNPWL